jgi:hypothetical protein
MYENLSSSVSNLMGAAVSGFALFSEGLDPAEGAAGLTSAFLSSADAA